MKKLSFIFIVTIAILLSSCGIHSGFMNDSAALSQANFKIVKTVSHEAKTLKVFGFGGLQKRALVAKAREALMAGANLQPNQTLTNVTVDMNLRLYPIVTVQVATITADVVEFQ